MDNMEKVMKMIVQLNLIQKVIKSQIIDASDSYILITGNIAIVNGDNNTLVAFKNCSLFTRCVTHINDGHIETADNLDLVMNLYNLIEYLDNLNAAGNIDNVNANDPSSFKYKSNLLKGLTTRDVAANEAANDNPDIANAHKLFLNAQIAVPLKYVSSFFWSLEMPLINCKINLN